MLNTTFIDASSRTNVHIKQQPHDAADAARLYGELDKKARDSVISSMRLDINNVKVVVHRCQDYMSALDIFRVVYSLNGKPQQFDVTQSMHAERSVEALWVLLRDALAKDLAENMLASIPPAACRSFFDFR